MVTAKFTLTTACGAKCATCPGWKRTSVHGGYTDLLEIWGRLVLDPMIDKIIVNNTGDLYCHPSHVPLLKFMESKTKGRFVAMTTNGARLDYIPKFSQFVLSWNGATPDTYEATTGLSWERTMDRVRGLIPELAEKYTPNMIEMHCLLYDGNDVPDAERRLLDAWEDWPGRIRVSRKYDNQMQADHTLEPFRRADRIPCDYLTMLNVEPDGVVSMCAHDWERTETFGSIKENGAAELMRAPRRLAKWDEHNRRRWTGVCASCNYNVPVTDQVTYIKG